MTNAKRRRRRGLVLLASPFALVVLYAMMSHAIEALRTPPRDLPVQLRSGVDTSSYDELVTLGATLDPSFFQVCDAKSEVTPECSALLAEYETQLSAIVARIAELDLEPQPQSDNFALRQSKWTSATEAGLNEVTRLVFALLAQVRRGCSSEAGAPAETVHALSRTLTFLLDAPAGFLQLIAALTVNDALLQDVQACSDTSKLDRHARHGARFDPTRSFQRAMVAEADYYERMLAEKEPPFAIQALGLYHHEHMGDLLRREQLPWFEESLPPTASYDPMGDWWWPVHDPMGRFNFRHIRNATAYRRFYDRVVELTSHSQSRL